MPTITFRTITQLSFTMDLDPTLTVADVKKKIAEERGDDYAVELQKLIYNGKILDDATTIEQVDIDPNKFVVVMLSRRKVAEPAPAPAAVAAPAAAPPPAPTPSSDVTASASEKQPENTPGSAVPAPAVVAAPAGESTPQPAPTQAAPTQPSFTADQESAIDAIQAMGYPRDQVIAALRAAFWNPDRAVEYLLNGIPDEEQIPIEVGGEEEGSEGGCF
ncbi:ubiquitin family protein [Ancylostoma duodenale]|uniref:Ubiquitin family protein n=1 Tax=Ancylostoma duodenale TaxID=51022 RepID=A0A0C2DXY0_9BILA|nr:ubiquitin family protein [Ancylostoma duodenale]